MKTPNRVELYNSQSTKTLELFAERIKNTNKEIEMTVIYILECRKSNIEIKKCEWVCDKSCGSECINL